MNPPRLIIVHESASAQGLDDSSLTRVNYTGTKSMAAMLRYAKKLQAASDAKNGSWGGTYYVAKLYTSNMRN